MFDNQDTQWRSQNRVVARAGPAAMVRPVRPWPYRFEGEKMASLGTFKRFSLHFFKPSSIETSDERIEASQFSIYIAILEREASAQIREGLGPVGDRKGNIYGAAHCAES